MLKRTLTDKNRRPWFVLAAALVTGLALAAPAPGASALEPEGPSVSRRAKVVLVVIDRIGLDDITGAPPASIPNITRLIEIGSISLMNVREKLEQYGTGGYVVIGSGGRALGGPNAGLAFNRDELLRTAGDEYLTAGDVFQARTGTAVPDGSVVNLFIEEMKKLSDTDLAESSPGLLGKVLTDAGLRKAVVGNADSLAPTWTGTITTETTAFQPVTYEAAPGTVPYPADIILHREVSCIAMDARGVVGTGDVSSRLSSRISPETGLSTDFDVLVGEAESLLETSDLLVVDMGQTSRVDEQSAFFTDKAIDLARAEALGECDGALGEIMGSVDLGRDLLIVCAPTPSRDMISDNELLTPLIIAGPGFSGGSLASPTTRRDTVVSNFDIAPTIIEFFGLDVPSDIEGRALTSKGPKRAGDLDSLAGFEDRVVGSSNTRKALVRVYVISALVLLALFLLLLFLRTDLLTAHPVLVSFALLYLLAGPLAYLLAPAISVGKLYAVIPVTVLISAALAAAALAWGRLAKAGAASEQAPVRLYRSMLFVSGLTLLAIALDPFLGSPLMTLSAFGSDVILAGRFYGIGNLYMGFMVGAAVLVACLSVELFKKTLNSPVKRYLVAGAVLLLAAFVLGFPKLGADVGGVITAVVAGMVLLAKLEGGHIGYKKVIVIVAVTCVIIVAVLAADLLLPGSASHAGRAVTRANSGGFGEVLSIAGRKMAANWSLLFASIWRLLLLLDIIILFLVDWKWGVFRRVKEVSPALSAGFFSLAVALVVALVFNDSGVEPAAAISVFLAVPYILVLLGLRGGAKRALPEAEAD